MRLSASSVAFPGLDLAELPQAVIAAGVEGIAINVADRSALRPDASPETVTAFDRRCRDHGVTVSAVYSYAGRRISLGGSAREQDIDLAKRCVDLAARLEAPVCRLFASTTRGTDAAIDRFVDACTSILHHATASGVTLAFPTHHDLAYDPASCRRLVAGFGGTGASIIFTGPNLQLDGIAPLDALAEMYDLVGQVELKDWRRCGGDAVPVAIGTGEAVVWPIVEALAVSGYSGWITLHHLKQHHPELPDLDRDVAAAVQRVFAAAQKTPAQNMPERAAFAKAERR